MSVQWSRVAVFLPSISAQHDAGFDVDHVVASQHRDRAGAIDPGRLQRLAQRGVAEDDRHVEVAHGGQEAVLLVLFDHRDLVAGGGQVLHHPHAKVAEPDDDEVIAQMPDPGARRRENETARKQYVGDKRHQQRGGGHAAEHQQRRERAQPGGLVDEAEVAVPGRGHRLDGEVERVDPAHLGRRPIAEPQHERRGDQHHQRRADDRIERRVEVVDHPADRRRPPGGTPCGASAISADPGTLMPWAANSSAVPIIIVQSPACTPRSRPGQISISPGSGESSPWMTATGARSP